MKESTQTALVLGAFLFMTSTSLWLPECFKQIKRVNVSGSEYLVSKWNNSPRTEVTRGSITSGRILVDENGDGIVDVKYNYFCWPRRGAGVYKTSLVEEDQKEFTQASAKYDTGTLTGFRGIEKSIRDLF